ncbi:MAG: 16S rRNA (adenine(1518)-N(6)/adenine(1519)-N(6))-dimethyltransferase RsmA [Ruminococcaceae bacterium]|nr:16S rRNA (adenine(1518)-N(6)/adenine(1519)-N(6))-dimethyltransferase RsmA [Oscillospiraceae bacterium]
MPRLTDLSTIRALCQKHGFSLSKGLGQHFLVNPAVCPRLCEAAGLGPGSDVLEIGPGFGTLTQELAARARRVVALEVDSRLLPVLDETLADYTNVRVVQGDVMQTDLNALVAKMFGGPVTVCANLPYYITSPVVMKLLESRLPANNLTLMVQKEAAQRMAAAPGSRQAGAISYAVHYYAQPKLVFDVSAGSFTPPPKVKSAVIRLDIRKNPPLADEPEREARLFRLVRAAFGQRRKTLVNAASAGLGVPKAALAGAMDTLGLPPLARPEELTLEQFMALEGELAAGLF